MATGGNIAIDSIGYTHSTPQHALGQIVEREGKVYRYVKNEDTHAATISYPCCLVNTDNDWTISADISSSLGEGNFAGVVQAAMATAEYGWILVKGEYRSCNITGAVGAGAEVIVDSIDGYFQASLDTEVLKPAGFAHIAATEAQTGNDFTIYIDAM